MEGQCCSFLSSDEYSSKRSQELLVEVATQGEESGYGVPCILISAKSDLNRYPLEIQDSMKVLISFLVSSILILTYWHKCIRL